VSKKATLVILPLVLTALACGRSQETARASTGARALRVRAAQVAVRDVVYRVSALGSLEADELVQVTAEVEGAVTGIRFREGDRVTPETILAQIDPDRYRLEAARAEATYRKAIADHERVAAELKRREELAREQLVAIEELNRAKQEAESQGASEAGAKAALEIAQQNLKRAAVRPPRSGVINTRTVETGQFVQVGTVLATLVDVSRLRLRFKVSEAESLSVRTGQPITFRVAALGERDFSAQVYHVGEVADATTRQVEVLAWVRNPGLLKPGFFAEVALATNTHKNAVVVPESAVQASERGFVAYAIVAGRAQQRIVKLGLRTGDGNVEIAAGLKPGEAVVTAGSDRLADGLTVETVSDRQPEPAERKRP
jgi:membrane fusion protein, multidrug efflux system